LIHRSLATSLQNHKLQNDWKYLSTLQKDNYLFHLPELRISIKGEWAELKVFEGRQPLSIEVRHAASRVEL